MVAIQTAPSAAAAAFRVAALGAGGCRANRGKRSRDGRRQGRRRNDCEEGEEADMPDHQGGANHGRRALVQPARAKARIARLPAMKAAP